MSGPLSSTMLELEIAADPAALVVVRRVTGALAVALGFDDSDVADLRLAVTEACSSFMAARADQAPGRPLQVRAEVLAGERLGVRVFDPDSPPPGPGTGPPLALLAALTDSFELAGTAAGGMEIRMTFPGQAPGG